MQSGLYLEFCGGGQMYVSGNNGGKRTKLVREGPGMLPRGNFT